MPPRSSVNAKDDLLLHEDVSFVGSVIGSFGHPLHSTTQYANHNQQDFFEQYKRVLGISFEIQKQLNRTLVIKQQMVQKLQDLQKNMDNSSIQTSEHVERKQSVAKRSRRMADEIQRKFKCNVEFCEKQYGSEGSLNQHIKLKHPELYSSL